ncbi:MAG: hypothetical protein H6659_08555 [Ardenticatenaceae bacterium]|nr:hypothetical protein [Ardenticatenaceae bacterium]MCB8988848.1 hypothetical protein [Ardenticatenaceae bacterium]
MSRYVKPFSDETRLRTLTMLYDKGLRDSQNNIAYLQADTLTQLGTLSAAFTAALTTSQTLQSERMQAVAAANTAVADLVQSMRRIWSAVKWRKKREDQPAAIFLYYQLPGNGCNPAIHRQADWLLTAQRMIQGEAEAVSAGYEPLVEPTMAELQTLLMAATLATQKRDDLKTAYESAHLALIDIRQQVDEGIGQSMDELRLALRQLPASSRRNVMRTYGAYFSPQPGERDEEEAAPTPPTPESSPEMAAPEPLSMAQPVLAMNGTAV